MKTKRGEGWNGCLLGLIRFQVGFQQRGVVVRVRCDSALFNASSEGEGEQGEKERTMEREEMPM